MKRWILIVCLLVPGLALADPLSPKPGYCITQNITSTTTDDFYVASGGRTLSIYLTPDDNGTGVGAGATLRACTTTNSDYCVDYTFTGFDSLLDGSPWIVEGIQVPGYIWINITDLTSGPAVVMVCAQ